MLISVAAKSAVFFLRVQQRASDTLRVPMRNDTVGLVDPKAIALDAQMNLSVAFCGVVVRVGLGMRKGECKMS